MSRIKLSTAADINNKDKWEDCFQWLKTQLNNFKRFFINIGVSTKKLSRFKG